MAWPCISRVCCLARFWNQFDKSDLSVPLTIQNYSDISEQEIRSVTKHVSSAGNQPSSPEPPDTRSPRDGTGARGSFRARREPGYKPREDYRPPGVPFPSLTQYKQDYKPWPIPRRENFPWISNGGSAADSPGRSAPVRAPDRAHRGGEPPGLEDSKTSSYRQEYRPWTGVRPAQSARRTGPAQYPSPGPEASHVPRETSYQAAYRSTGLPQGQHLIPSAASSVQPAPDPRPGPQSGPQTGSQSGPQTGSQSGPRPGPAVLQVGTSSNACSLQQSVLPSSGQSSAEEHLVRTKLPPNPSAVFQSGPRVFNI